jgi:UTP--glucose-1-phosphate uridylyltransferase
VPGAGGEIQLTDGISALLKHERISAVRLPGRRYDCGSKIGYLQATLEYGLRHAETGEEFSRYLKSRKNA